MFIEYECLWSKRQMPTFEKYFNVMKISIEKLLLILSFGTLLFFIISIHVRHILEIEELCFRCFCQISNVIFFNQ